AYTAWTGTVDVEVSEALTFTTVDGQVMSTESTVVWSGTTLTVNLMPGECVYAGVDVVNNSSVDLSVTAEMVKTAGTTTFQEGTTADFTAALAGDPAPAYSWIYLSRGPGAQGNPITFNAPAGGLPLSGPAIAIQAGADIVPGNYTFRLTIKR
ncbi:unnamed protein product, partial [marine sediment metagenome]